MGPITNRYWAEFQSKYGNEDWNSPAMKKTIKDYFDNCTNDGWCRCYDSIAGGDSYY